MRHYIFGFDSNAPERCAQALHEQGVNAVVAGNFDQRTVDILNENAIEPFLCYGAHGLSGDFATEAHMAVDAQGKPRRWFSSGCPNDERLADFRLNAVLEKAQHLKGLRGIFVDGARFASFASTESAEAFFTCFCPRCMKKMEENGFDARQIRSAVHRLQWTRRVSPEDSVAVREWLRFREFCVWRYMERFSERVHALPGGLLAGGFVFAPSLAVFVGQTAKACAALDIVAPMLYRNYPHKDGTACLGHEWAGMNGLFGEECAQLIACAGSEEAMAGFEAIAVPERLMGDGFSPEWVGVETGFAQKKMAPGQCLQPIVQIEDPSLEETVRAALLAGADGVGYFMYGQAELNLPKVQ